MDKTVKTLLVLGLIALAIYIAIRQGWIKWPMNNSSGGQNTPNANQRVQIVEHAPEQVITEPMAVQVDHSAQGYVLIPVDNNGNVVPQNMATQFIRFEHKGQDCDVQYRNVIYFVRPRPVPPPPEPHPVV